MAQHKIIISCAVTGSIHTPSMSPHLPVTAAEIAESALGAANAGAAIVHLHARNPIDGRPDQSPEAFEPFLRVIKQSSNVVVNLTTGGSPYMTVEERVRPAATWKPEVASLNMGSMNFGLFPMLKRYKSFAHDWEPRMLEDSHDLVFRNSFKDIRYALETLNSSGARRSNATTPVTSIICTISGPRDWSRLPCSSRPASACSAVLARIPTMSCT
jgi:uncharacterized protein (DUF849 family)